MNINEVAKRLRKLGIPGDEKERSIRENLVHKDSIRVGKAVEKYIEKTLVRWAYTEKVIDPPTRRKENGKVVRGAGKTSEWPPETVEEVAAVWAVRNCGVMKPKTLTKERIEIIRNVAARLDNEPFAIYTLSPIAGPLSTKRVATKDIEMKFVSEKCEGLDLFPGETKDDKVNNLNNLVVTWITTIEKVREWVSRGIKAQAAESEWGKLIPAEIDFSQIDPWLIEVPCPWRIDKPACVTLSYFSRSSTKKGRKFSRPPFPFQRSLSKSNHDDIILLDNWVDTRKFFTIDVAAGEEYAKARKAEIEQKIQNSKSPVEKMTLMMSQAHIKTWFGV